MSEVKPSMQNRGKQQPGTSPRASPSGPSQIRSELPQRKPRALRERKALPKVTRGAGRGSEPCTVLSAASTTWARPTSNVNCTLFITQRCTCPGGLAAQRQHRSAERGPRNVGSEKPTARPGSVIKGSRLPAWASASPSGKRESNSYLPGPTVKGEKNHGALCAPGTR